MVKFLITKTSRYESRVDYTSSKNLFYVLKSYPRKILRFFPYSFYATIKKPLPQCLNNSCKCNSHCRTVAFIWFLFHLNDIFLIILESFTYLFNNNSWKLYIIPQNLHFSILYLLVRGEVIFLIACLPAYR